MGGFELEPGQRWAIGITIAVVTIGLILLFLWMLCVIPSIGKPLARCSKASKTPAAKTPASKTPATS